MTEETKPERVTLTKVQERGLFMIDEEGSYSRGRNGSPNFYHDRHRPGSLYVDVRTANVLIRLGFAEVRWGRLFLTSIGRDYRRAYPRKA